MDQIIERLRPIADRFGIPLDKLLHFLAGALISVVLIVPFGPLVASLTALAAGAAKEAYDRLDDQEGDVELADVMWTWAGGSVLPLIVAVVAAS